MHLSNWFADSASWRTALLLELILKPELVLSSTEKSHHSTSFRTGSREMRSSRAHGRSSYSNASWKMVSELK
ncbi:hypothetical protein Mal48_25820 [Thalassoglobus polymorphus]|uniref:Uncharacterized protein n=1 Tax=Thalassoglobus polymorphus TaxID=2527994 RepID=A0A517QNX5_9PLAN|nr:hypothetical protein Mal48_25820 [Thalassoglobus polymorphus]